MNTKEKTTTDAATSAVAAGGTSGETISEHNFNTSGGNRQPGGHISRFLMQGEENAVPASTLAQMAGVSPRTLRHMVDRERLECPICASDFGYFLPDLGDKGIMELRRFVRRQDSRCVANRRVTKSARAVLKELEHRPLDGQETFFNGGGD